MARRLGVPTTSLMAATLAGLLSVELRAEPPSAPPQALPTHSALPEDARPVDAMTPPWRTASAAMLPPPSANGADFVPLPPLGVPQPAGPSVLAVPPEAPWFSWTPTYIPPGAKSGALQQSLFRATYLPRLNASGGFGMTDVTKQVTLAVPPFIAGSPILITPSLTSHFLDGPGSVDLPSEVFSGELEFRYMKQATPRLGIDLAIAPSYFGDTHNDSSDAWRVTGKALAARDWTPTVKLVAGGLLLGREDYPALPAGGVIWKPTPEWRFDVIFPRPRIYYRFLCNGTVEHHVYLGGEFGGNTWAIDHAGGTPDKFTYSDLRLVLGYERYAPGGISGRFETGWVFDRKIEFESGIPGFNPDDTFLVRGEFSF